MARIPGQTPEEKAYGEGKRRFHPTWSEMSPQTQGALEQGFTTAMSGWKTREQELHDKGGASALRQPVIDRLDDRTVTIDDAASNLAGRWDAVVAAGDVEPAWYFGHNRRTTRIADQGGLRPRSVIDASASMSPQNSPDQETRAAASMTDAAVNNRMVRENGKARRLTAMTPQEMQDTTSAKNAKNVTAASGFDLAGFRSAGTNRQEGWKTIVGAAKQAKDPSHQPYNAIDEMESGKAPIYSESTAQSLPDTPLHHEYEMRLGDQQAARRANASGQKAVDRVDVYGLAGGGSDPSDPAFKHPVLGEEGLAVIDTWMTGIMSGQQLLDEPGSPSPGKMAGSQSRATSLPLGDHTFTGPTEAHAQGGKAWGGNAAAHAAGMRAVQEGARKAREPGSQTNIPPQMLQEMTWVHERANVARSTAALRDAGEIQPGTAANRINKLTGGTLEGEKEFRPAPEAPGAPADLPAGRFSRTGGEAAGLVDPEAMRRAGLGKFTVDETTGADLGPKGRLTGMAEGWNPLDTDSVRVLSPESSAATPPNVRTIRRRQGNP